MKKGIFVSVLVWFAALVVAPAQGLNERFVMVASFGSSTVLNDSTFRTNVSFPSSQIGAFTPSMIQVGDEAVDGNGRRYRVDSVVSALLFTATLDLVKMQTGLPAPTLTGLIFTPGANDIIPVGPTGTFGISASLLARIINHMQMEIDSIVSPGPDTSGYNLSFEVVGDSLCLTDGQATLCVALADVSTGPGGVFDPANEADTVRISVANISQEFSFVADGFVYIISPEKIEIGEVGNNNYLQFQDGEVRLYLGGYPGEAGYSLTPDAEGVLSWSIPLTGVFNVLNDDGIWVVGRAFLDDDIEAFELSNDNFTFLVGDYLSYYNENADFSISDNGGNWLQNGTLGFEATGDDSEIRLRADVIELRTNAGFISTYGDSLSIETPTGYGTPGQVLTKHATDGAIWADPTGGDPDQTLSISNDTLTISGSGGNSVVLPEKNGLFNIANNQDTFRVDTAFLAKNLRIANADGSNVFLFRESGSPAFQANGGVRGSVTSGTGVDAVATTGTGTNSRSTSGVGLRASSVTQLAIQATVNDSASTGYLPVMRIVRSPVVVTEMQANAGAYMDYHFKNSDNISKEAGRVGMKWDSNVNNNESARFELDLMSGGSMVRRLAVFGAGQLTLDGYTTNNFIGTGWARLAVQADGTVVADTTTIGGGSGTVTSITAGTGLTGGTITTSGTIAADTATILASKTYVTTRGYTTGSGTTNYIPKWTSSTGLGNSLIYDSGTNIGIGTASPAGTLDIRGNTLQLKAITGTTIANNYFGLSTTLNVKQANIANDYGDVKMALGNTSIGWYDYVYKSRSTNGTSYATINTNDDIYTAAFVADGGTAVGNTDYVLEDVISVDGAKTAGGYIPGKRVINIRKNDNTDSYHSFAFRASGRFGILTADPQRTLHVVGEARITDLTTDPPTRIVGADADGDLGQIIIGTGLSLSLSGDTLTATGGSGTWLKPALEGDSVVINSASNTLAFNITNTADPAISPAIRIQVPGPDDDQTATGIEMRDTVNHIYMRDIYRGDFIREANSSMTFRTTDTTKVVRLQSGSGYAQQTGGIDGNLRIVNGYGKGAKLRLTDYTNGGGYVQVASPDTVPASWTLTLPEAAPANGQVLTAVGTTGKTEWAGGVPNPVDTTIHTATTTCLLNNITLVNSTGGAITVDPPASPVPGNRFSVSDAYAQSATNNITIDFDSAGQKLYAVEQNYILNTNGAYVEFIYVSATVGWIATKG